MPKPHLPEARRTLLVRTALAALICAVLLAPGPASRGHSAGSTSAVDHTMGRGDCALMGRVFVAGRGCSRTRCVRSAHPAKAARGAEMCTLAHQGRYAFGAAVEYRRCGALHRRWIAQVNWCASNPDRSKATIRNAPQCTAPATTYVTHTEKEGRYDECLDPQVVRQLGHLARREGTTLEREAALRSPVLCLYRPRHVFLDGRCVHGRRPDPSVGDVLLVGDSIAWRGTDELGQLRPDFDIDGIPARRLTDLEPRLDWFRLDHGDPTGLIVELGTNAASNFARHDLRAVVNTLPVDTVVMLVLPYRRNPHAPPAIQPSSTRYATWMRALADDRPHTCVADWRAQVLHRPSVLIDGVHPTHRSEKYWAHWVSTSWNSCLKTKD